MRDIQIGVGLSLAAILISALVLLLMAEEGDALNKVDKRRYAVSLSPKAAMKIQREAVGILGNLFPKRESEPAQPQNTERGSIMPNSGGMGGFGSAQVGQASLVPIRRMILIGHLWPLWVFLIGGSLWWGLAIRKERADLPGWRSPLAAYLAKKCLIFGGVIGTFVYATLPISLPLWLLYLPIMMLCGGLALYIGSLGKL